MIPLLGARNHSVTRRTAGTYVDGVFVDSVDSVFDVYGSIQPLDGRTRELLEEGARAKGRYKLHTEAELNIVDPLTQTRGDLVTFKGRNYEVVAAFDWTEHVDGLPHYTYVLSEVTSV